MNFEAIKAIYLFEMARTRRTLLQSVVSSSEPRSVRGFKKLAEFPMAPS